MYQTQQTVKGPIGNQVLEVAHEQHIKVNANI